VSFGGRVATVDGTSIALRHGLGSETTPIVNTALLGALVRVGEVVSLDALVRAIAMDVPVNPDGNAAAAREGYAAVHSLEAVIA